MRLQYMFENNCEANFPNGDPGEGEYYVSFYNKIISFCYFDQIVCTVTNEKKNNY